MQLEDRIALADPIAGCGQHHDTDRRIDGVLNLVATGTEGDGRAADLWMADQEGYPVKDASPLLALVDQMAPALGLSRPMRWADPPHVQLNGEWQEIAGILREQRLRNSPEASERSSSNR